MADYVKTHEDERYLAVWFYNEDEKPLAIGEKMYTLNPDAYMNGYTWEALFNYYLGKHAPELLEGLDSDPEAGSYAAYYKPSQENRKKMEKFAEIITYLIENEDVLYRLVQEEGCEIEWD